MVPSLLVKVSEVEWPESPYCKPQATKRKERRNHWQSRRLLNYFPCETLEKNRESEMDPTQADVRLKGNFTAAFGV